MKKHFHTNSLTMLDQRKRNWKFIQFSFLIDICFLFMKMSERRKTKRRREEKRRAISCSKSFHFSFEFISRLPSFTNRTSIRFASFIIDLFIRHDIIRPFFFNDRYIISSSLLFSFHFSSSSFSSSHQYQHVRTSSRWLFLLIQKKKRTDKKNEKNIDESSFSFLFHRKILKFSSRKFVEKCVQVTFSPVKTIVFFFPLGVFFPSSLILIVNDGNVYSQLLCHLSFQIKKICHKTMTKIVSK